MANVYKHSILVVDDDRDVREILKTLLIAEGYEVRSAEHGLSALTHLRGNIPDLIISDLQMPQMSGFEFLSIVRRRFPQISVIASSGLFNGDEIPAGVLADAFHAKGNSLNSLLRTIAGLMRTAASRAGDHAELPSPMWVPPTGRDPSGTPYIVLSCSDCLRSFSLSVPKEPTSDVLSTPCIFCSNAIDYIIDFSRSLSTPSRPAGDAPSILTPHSERVNWQ